MARLPRLVVPGYPHHLVQRGNNRQAIFVDDLDRDRYLKLLAEASRQHALPIHAFVLMPNHVHLLVTPATEEAMAAAMQDVGRAYVHWFNKRHQRTGTLFEGRFRSCVVETDRYALACTRYIEMNPVRAGIVNSPADFRWSSYRHNVGLQPHPLVTEHAATWALGNTPFERQLRYKKMFEVPMDESAITAIRTKLNKGLALGDESWIQNLAQHQNRPVQEGKRGRPFKRS